MTDDADGDPATVVDKPSARERPAVTTPPVAPPPPEPASASVSRASLGSEPGRSTGAGTTVMSPIEAMQRAEILSTRNFCKVGFALCIAAVIVVPLLPGHPISTYVFLGSIATAMIALVYLYRRTRDPATYYQGVGVAIAWYVPAASVCGAVPFFGPFSAVSILLVVGVYFTASGASFRLALALYLTCALVQGTVGGAVIAGATDPGFIRADYLSLRVQIICQLLIQFVLAGTFVIARGSRRSQLAAISELEKAVRAVAQREALLEEAREELRRAVGSGRGRFTDQTIGKYRLGEIIGRGAMGEVYEAVNAAGEPVAVKMLSQASLGNAHHVQRFMRELEAASAIDSPNVVRVLDVGREPLPHLVMERLRGRDLSAILRGKSRSAMSHEQIIDMLRQAGTGITAAGAAGIIHRDLKPQNLFLAGKTWKVLDFGVSRVAEAGDTLTAGQVVGTPAYMAPEQARGGTVDHKTDLYALAAIAYRALTGHPPFSGGEIVDLLYRVVHSAPRRPSSLARLHADVDLVLALGLAKNPADRFASASELVDAIAAALAGNLSSALRDRARALELDGAWANPAPARGVR